MTVSRELLARPALLVAPRLLGAVIRSRVGEETVSIRITEVEAYMGSDDPASHAFRGSTPRTSVMFGSAGRLYCYFTYGMHWCANIVCDVDGNASAVLLRAGEVVDGLAVARARRPSARKDVELARGPARLAGCLAVGRAQNGTDLCTEGSQVELVSMPRRRLTAQAGPRVGISRATEQPWRFWLPDDPTVSTFRAGGGKPRRTVRQTGPL
jgi:DNA-3-methyladenine glycosylase